MGSTGRLGQPYQGGSAEAQEYIIPEDDKAKVLRELYPFENPPSVEDRLFCLHEKKTFRVGDFKVIREDERNYLVSPYYAKSGGMVIDWVTEESKESFLFRVTK